MLVTVLAVECKSERRNCNPCLPAPSHNAFVAAAQGQPGPKKTTRLLDGASPRHTAMPHPSPFTRPFVRFASAAAGFLLPWLESSADEGAPSTNSPAESQRPVIGAIRWDAWYGEGSVTKALEKTLGQRKYHFRLPWFAQIRGEEEVYINGDSPEIMAREISYAAQAGLNYWAFLHYWQEAPELGIALQHYLHSSHKRGIRYCLLEEGGRLDKIGLRAWPQLVEHFRSPDYQKVLGGRPLLFVYTRPKALGRADWAELKRQAVEAGMAPPYLVLMGWEMKQDAQDMEELGFDALSAYARGGSYSMEQPSYAEQSRLVRERLWDPWQKQHIPCVTLASAGWDTRPRNERPPPWIQTLVEQPSPDPTPFSQQKPLLDPVTASPSELSAHLLEAIQWTQSHRALNRANAILIYAWNEHDEGGWLQPTLGADGHPNEERIEALSKILHAPTAPARP